MRRLRFTILDGLGLIAVLALVFVAFRFVPDLNQADAGAAIFWLVMAGVALVLALVHRIPLARETRLIVLGLAVAFAGAADGLYLAAYIKVEGVAIATVVGLTLVGAVLVGGGIVEGLAADRPLPRPESEETRP